MKKIAVVFVVLIAALSTVLYLKLRDQAAEAEGPTGGSATVEGTRVHVTARIPGRVEVIHVREGDKVEAGAVLVELDCAEPEARMAQAKAGLEAARAALEPARAQIPLAEAGVEAARKQEAAAEAAAAATRAQARPVSASRQAARRAAKRVETLQTAGGASAQDLDKAQTQVAVLGGQLQAARAAAKAQAKQAEAASTGVRAAALKVAAAKAQVEALERQVKVAESHIALAQVGVGECKLVAPRAGIVTVRALEPGEPVLPGTRVLEIVDLEVVTAVFYVPNAELAAAKVGGAVSLVADAWPDERFEGTIQWVGAQAAFTPRNVQTREDRDRLVYPVEVRVPNEKGLLRPGMPVEVKIDGSERSGRRS